jgi:ATP-binding cassette, subfamily B, multidrug efflux pump
MGNVNAELQESISAVREVQAFNRADENIEQFPSDNAANRDANVRAVAFTSALAPTLEALGYVALMIVTVVGGLCPAGPDQPFGTAVSLGLVITFIGYVQRFNQPDPADLGAVDQHPERHRRRRAHLRLAGCAAHHPG